MCKQLDDEGLKLGGFGRIFAFMVKYITTILIAVIEVFGVVDVIFPSANGERSFSSGGLVVVLTAYAILLIVVAIYFLFLKNKTTGSNADEGRDQ